jgi:hypothetical protein
MTFSRRSAADELKIIRDGSAFPLYPNYSVYTRTRGERDLI